MATLRRLLLPIACVLLVSECASGRSTASRGQMAATYEVHALRYGTLAQFAVAGLVAGADPARRMDIALMVWLIRAPDDGGGRTVLMDAGFYREKFVTRWKPVDYVRPSVALLTVRHQSRAGHRHHCLARPLGSSRRGGSLLECTNLDPARGIRAPR